MGGYLSSPAVIDDKKSSEIIVEEIEISMSSVDINKYNIDVYANVNGDVNVNSITVNTNWKQKQLLDNVTKFSTVCLEKPRDVLRSFVTVLKKLDIKIIRRVIKLTFSDIEQLPSLTDGIIEVHFEFQFSPEYIKQNKGSTMITQSNFIKQYYNDDTCSNVLCIRFADIYSYKECIKYYLPTIENDVENLSFKDFLKENNVTETKNYVVVFDDKASLDDSWQTNYYKKIKK